MHRLICYFSLILFTNKSYGVGYSHALARGSPLSFELYAGMASINLTKTGNPAVSESGTGIQAGFSGGFYVRNSVTLIGTLSLLSASTKEGSKTLGHFEQGIDFENQKKSSYYFRYTLGWQLYYLTSKPTEYGYNALTGVFLGLNWDFDSFIIYTKLSPIFNSGTIQSSNINYNLGFKYRIGNKTGYPLYLNAEFNMIKFYSSITLNESQVSQTLITVSKIF